MSQPDVSFKHCGMLHPVQMQTKGATIFFSKSNPLSLNIFIKLLWQIQKWLIVTTVVLLYKGFLESYKTLPKRWPSSGSVDKRVHKMVRKDLDGGHVKEPCKQSICVECHERTRIRCQKCKVVLHIHCWYDSFQFLFFPFNFLSLLLFFGSCSVISNIASISAIYKNITFSQKLCRSKMI